MKFEDMREPDKEAICAVEQENGRDSVAIRWIYPMKYGKIIIFQVPRGQEFREDKALKGEYPSLIFQSPRAEAVYQRKEAADLYLFPCSNSEEILYRQSDNKAVLPICVRYSVSREEKKGGVLQGLLRKNHGEKPVWTLKVRSEQSIGPEALYYQLPGVLEGFQFPCGLEKDRTWTCPMESDKILILSEREDIIVEKTEENGCLFGKKQDETTAK